MGDKGIDIFRVYQTVQDWQAVRDSDVLFCWIKATNGNGIATFNADRGYAPAPADPTVEGALSVGIAPGLYHYALGGSPEAQAEVFAREVNRLGCKGPGYLPPALDAEELAIGPTWAARREWCIRFLLRLRELVKQDRVAIYMNASWAANTRPDQWDIPGLVIWVAAYGPNDGGRHAIPFYEGRFDVYQFTSQGLRHVRGIRSEGLDVNEANTPLSVLLGHTEEDDMFTDDDRKILQSLQSGKAGERNAGEVFAVLNEIAENVSTLVEAFRFGETGVRSAGEHTDWLATQLGEIKTKLDAIKPQTL